MTVPAGVQAAKQTLAKLDQDRSTVSNVLVSFDRVLFYEFLTDYICEVGSQLPVVEGVIKAHTAAWLEALRQKLNDVLPSPDYAHIDQMISATESIITLVIDAASQGYPDLSVDDTSQMISEKLKTLRSTMIERDQAIARHFDEARDSIRNVMIDAGIRAITLKETKISLTAVTMHCSVQIMEHSPI